MTRLTHEENGKWCLRIGETVYTGTPADRLAAYENTGLEPEELMSLLQNIKAVTEHLPTANIHTSKLEEIRNRPWNTLTLSTRAYHCIKYMHRRDNELPDVKTIGELADMHHLDVYRIGKCGPGTRKEIAAALQEAGIDKSDWYTFLNTPAPKRKPSKPNKENALQDRETIDCCYRFEILEKYLGDSESKAIWQGWSANLKGNVNAQLACLEQQQLLTKEENIKKLRSAFQNDPFLRRIQEELEVQ